MNDANCIICGKPTHRKPNPYRPCCRKCERTASMAVQAPRLFLDRPGPAQTVARAVLRIGGVA